MEPEPVLVGKGSSESSSSSLGGLSDLRLDSREEREAACRVAGSLDLGSDKEVEEERERGGEVWMPMSRWKSSVGSEEILSSSSSAPSFLRIWLLAMYGT